MAKEKATAATAATPAATAATAATAAPTTKPEKATAPAVKIGQRVLCTIDGRLYPADVMNNVPVDGYYSLSVNLGHNHKVMEVKHISQVGKEAGAIDWQEM